MKGKLLGRFRVGQHICYTTRGAQNTDCIVKLHKSCSQGVAEIRPDNGSCKISRRLQNISAI